MQRIRKSVSQFSLILLFLLALLPATGLIIYTGLQQRQAAAQRAQEDALRITRLVSAEYRRQVEGTHQLLVGLSQVNAVRQNDPQACSEFLKGVLELFPQYTNLGLADIHGDIACTAIPSQQIVNVLDRSWFQRSLATMNFAHGEFQKGRISNKPQINFGVPVLGFTGQLRGVVYAALDLNWLTQLAVSTTLPDGAVFTIYDQNGSILARSPDSQTYLGQSVRDRTLYQSMLSASEGTSEGIDLDGIPRLVGYVHLEEESDRGSNIASIGIPTSIAYAPAKRELTNSLLIFGSITLVALAATWTGAYFLIRRRVTDLVGVTRRMAGGDLSARTRLAYGWTEFGELAKSFDDMGNALQKKMEENRVVAEELRCSEQQYRNLVELSPDAIYIHCDGLLVYGNPAFVKMLGATGIEELLGTPALQYVHPDDRSIVQERVQAIAVEGKSLPPIYERYVRLDGTVVHAEVVAGPIAYNGKPASQVIARDISERKRAEEARLRRAEELASLYETSLEIGVQRDLNQLLKSITARAAHMVEARSGGLYLVNPNDGNLELFVSYNLPQSLIGTVLQSGEGVAGRVAVSGHVLQVEDYSTWPDRSDHYDQVSFHRVVGVPMKIGQRVIGVISLTDEQKTGTYTEDEIRLVSLFADQAAVAVENARLYEAAQYELAERQRAEQAMARMLDEQTILHAVALAGNEATNLDDLAERITRLIEEKLYSDDFGLVFLDEDSGTLWFHSSYRIRNGVVQPIIHVGEGIIGWVAEHKQPRLVADVLDDPDYINADPLTRSEICVPILLGEKLLGVINAESTTPRKFLKNDERLLVALAGELGTAIHKLFLLEAELHRSHELSSLTQVSVALRPAQNREEMLPILLEQLKSLLDVDASALLMIANGRDRLEVEAAQGIWAQSCGIQVETGSPFFKDILARSTLYLNNQVEPAAQFKDALLGEDVAAVVFAPLAVQDEVIGILCAGRNRPFNNDETHLLSSIAEIAANAVHRATLHEQTILRLQRLSTLRTIDMTITASIDAQLTLSILLDQTLTSLKLDAADILLFNPASRMLEWGAGRGFHHPALSRTRVPISGLRSSGRQSPVVEAVLERHPVSIPDLSFLEDARSRLLMEEGFTSFMVIPFIAKGQVKGVMEVFHRTPPKLDQEWMDFLESLAGQAAIALDNIDLFNNLQRSNLELAMAYDATIEGWSRALDLRDEDTEFHTTRVTEKTLELARRMGIPENQIVHLRRGALLHDIGKMAVPDSILLKPGPLTPEEWDVMRLHPVHAYHLLTPISFLRPALDIPYTHHEKWDGSGYPQGLSGEDIPLAARIFAVVDVWDALSSDRPYRKAWPEEKVREYLHEQSGKHFDPEVVGAFFRLQGWLE